MAGGQEATRDEVAAEIVASRGGLGLPFELLLASPEVARRTASLGEYLRFHSELAADLRELAILVTAHEQRCDFEWRQHRRLAVKAGTTEAALEVVEHDDPSAPLERSGESVVIETARELLRAHRIPDALRERVVSVVGDRGFLELAATIGYYSHLAIVMNAYQQLGDEAD